MSSRPFLPPYKIFNATSLGATVSSSPTSIGQMSMVGFDISYTGTPTGSFSVEVSNSFSRDASGAVLNAGNWTALTLSTPVDPAGAAGTGFIDITQISAAYIRLTYTRTSGTGTVTAYISGKVA